MATLHTDAGSGARGVHASEEARAEAGSLGFKLLLATLGMLFGAVVLGVLAIRLGNTSRPDALPPLPWQVWVSTVALFATSIAFMEVVAAQRRGSDAGIRVGLVTAGCLALLFSAMQGWAWYDWYEGMPEWEAATQQYRIGVMGFWVFTSLHVAHVLGGLVPLAMVGWYAVFRTWTASRSGLLRHTATYWHFLDAVWIVLLVTMLLVL
ncbi:MAG: hypothetical protein QF733_04355 [Phycisphaerales bacterium]|jgi:cytochrome c oxidase subunit 3|nr:hypothetical protein [Phycisphaerales bacterium]